MAQFIGWTQIGLCDKATQDCYHSTNLSYPLMTMVTESQYINSIISATEGRTRPDQALNILHTILNQVMLMAIVSMTWTALYTI